MSLKQILDEIMVELIRDLRLSLEAQGHSLTGKLRDSIVYEINADGSGMTATVLMEGYGQFVETGVTADRIPFSIGGQRGAKGGRSLYIQGLIRFWEHRGLSGREAMGAAFATAIVHKRQGMPTTNAHGYSSTGERTGFIRTVLDSSIPKIQKLLEDKYAATVSLQLAEAFTGERSKGVA